MKVKIHTMISNLNKQKKSIILFLIYSLSILTVLTVYKDYGIHIEEKFHRLNGHYWLNYVSELFGFDNLKILTERKISEISDYTLSPVSVYNKYSVIFDLPTALLEILLKIDDVQKIYYLKHILSFFIFLLSSLFFFKILEKKYKNFYLSLTGLILYITTPRILGDSFLYKDVLFLSFFTITFYFFYKSLTTLSYKSIFIFSILSSICVNLRIFAILVPILFIALIIMKNFYLNEFINSLKKITFYLISFFFFLFIFWPYLWLDPLNNFIELFKSVKNDLINVKIFYNDMYISNRTLPDIYLLKWIGISSPPLQFILFLLGFFYCFIRFIKRFISIKKNNIYNDLWRGINEELDVICFLMLVLFYFIFIFFNAPLYNGWRLVYFFNFFLIYFSINCLYLIKISIIKKRFINIFFLLVIFLISNNIYAIIKTHPFQSIYFNSLMSKKNKNIYEGDYHGLASKHFFEKIIFEDDREIINIAVASHTPIQRGLEGISFKFKKKLNIVGQEYNIADYIFKNNISEVNSKLIKKYDIPKNFSKMYELEVDKVIIYEIYKRDDL